MRILIIDDSLAIRKIVSEMLKRNGHESVHAEDGTVAIELLRKGEKYDVILLDWNMPIMQGPEVLDTIHQENLTSCPIVMMTTENSPAFIVKALSKGASEYIMKPFTEEIINEKILMVTKGAA